MAWTPPNLRSSGYRVPSDVWNTEIVGNLLALSTHTHSGADGDGAAMAVPRPLAFQAEVANTAATIVLFSENILGGAFGTTGQYRVLLNFLLLNTSGAARTWTLGFTYGGSTVSLATNALASGANRRQMVVEMLMSVQGAPNSQRIQIRHYTSAALAAGAAGTMPASAVDDMVIYNDIAVDSTALQALALTMTMSAAHADLRFILQAGTIWGPIYGP